MKKTKLFLSWALRILLALGYIAASLGKLSGHPEVIQMFENWGYPEPFYLVIGIFELLFAVLILIPKTLKIALIGLVALMLGALLTHLINDPLAQMIRPLLFIGLLAWVYYLNFYSKKQAPEEEL